MANPRGFRTLAEREISRFLSLPNQTIWPAVVNAILYIVVFGFFLGSRVSDIEGVPYITFIFPGLLMMGVVLAAFQNASSSLFIARWEHFIEDLLVAPISFLEMVVAYVLASVVRGVLSGLMVLIAGILLVKTPLEHPFLLVVSLVLSSIVFSASGLIVGLWAERWDNIAIYLNYVVTPLMFLGGVFYSTSTLPEGYRWVNYVNPIFYMVEAVRYAFLGRTDVPFALSMAVTVIIASIFFLWAVYLFKKGYKLRT
ncbi:MAG TPA: ABC transporter permease [Bdellovibrionota bacterium]|nr:ABC transporter permease [Bdellovibrionota bacterium]